jgi:hypothetical protein
MLRIVATLLVLVTAAGIAAEACGPGGTTPSPTPSLTIADPSPKPRTPSATIEVPPPID